MQSPSRQRGQLNLGLSKRNGAGILHWILMHRPSWLIVPPLILLALGILLTVPLLNDLRLLSEDELALVEQEPAAGDHDGNLIVNVKNINPNNGVATVDLTYVTDDLDKGKVELWLTSGSGTIKEGKLSYETDTELHRVPIVMDSPTVFVWGETKRATYKQENTEIKIDQRTQCYFYPFDRYVIGFSFAIADKSQTMLQPKLWCELEDPHFVNAPPKPLMSDGENAVLIPNSLTVALVRPIYQKIFMGLSVLMGFGCVVWAFYKITYTSITATESLSLLAFNFTVLVAVPALRGVLLPSNLQFAPLFDFFVVLIWTVGLLALVVNIVRHDIIIRGGELPSMDHHADLAAFGEPNDGGIDKLTRSLPRKAAG
jgi:hypothetical protein